MTRSVFVLALVAAATLATSALTQAGEAPRNDLPQAYRTTRDWGELPPGMKWAAVTAVEQAPDELPGIKKGIRVGSVSDGRVFAFIEDLESTTGEHSGTEGVGVDSDGNVYGAVVRSQMLERPVKK